MATRVEKKRGTGAPLPGYRSILLAVDSSDHSNHGVTEAAALAGLWDAKVTAIHVYATRLHSLRFRQMEGGLPERFREERALERQRDVHDDLITRGLSIISDAYLDQAERACARDGIRFAGRALEGKNYRVLADETNSGAYDLLVIGARGLGAVAGNGIGTVCMRVARRSDIDALIVRNGQKRIADGPIVAAVDGSARSYGGLRTAFALAERFAVPVKVVAAFDPYYHYVAFKRIAEVLSDEAARVFRFHEQERLHEELIDSGLARIYEGHLAVAASMADEHGIEIETRLLDGKPYDAIERYVRSTRPSLLVIGKLGIHADAQLDIGGNAETLMRNVECPILLSQRMHEPDPDVLAGVTTSWTSEAERRMERVPEFVRDMARLAILRHAQERGHTVITERIVEEATSRWMPGSNAAVRGDIGRARDGAGPARPSVSGSPLAWTANARSLLDTIEDQSLRHTVKARAEKKARLDQSDTVRTPHVAAFLDHGSPARGDRPDRKEPHWEAAAIARLMRVPAGAARERAKARIEDYASEHDLAEITLDAAERGLAGVRGLGAGIVPEGRVGDRQRSGTCPPADRGDAENGGTGRDPPVPWTETAEHALLSVPEGSYRDMTRAAIETIAAQKKAAVIDVGLLGKLMNAFASGSHGVTETLPWDHEARARIAKAPDMVRGMLIKEIEAWVERHGLDRVDRTAVDGVREEWRDRGLFHLDPDDPRSRRDK